MLGLIGPLFQRNSALLYHHRSDQHRVEVIDLDPYGTAAPFIDGAVQAVADGGKVSEL
jgi:tRNA G26 N,N-dimethylase Trm1